MGVLTVDRRAPYRPVVPKAQAGAAGHCPKRRRGGSRRTRTQLGAAGGLSFAAASAQRLAALLHAWEGFAQSVPSVPARCTGTAGRRGGRVSARRPPGAQRAACLSPRTPRAFFAALSLHLAARPPLLKQRRSNEDGA